VITLITGVPGAGKTLNTLKLVQEEWGKSGRPVYYRGIKDLKLPWTEIDDEQCRKWYEFDDGAIFVIDEIQQVFPRRAPNHKPPEGVARLDTHRHRGFDFYIITQKPKNFDFEARGYVGRHRHYERGYGREATRCLEWQQACDDPGDYHRRQEAEVSRVKFDKKYYDVYTSASLHTVQKKLPKKLWLFVAACLATVAMGVMLYNSMSERLSDQDPQLAEAPQGDLISQPGLSSPFIRRDSIEDLDFFTQHTPRVDGLDWTAPIYDEVREVRDFPRPQCIRVESSQQCQCYSQQATPMNVKPELCNAIVDGGWFNPYKEPYREGAEGEAVATPAPPRPAFDPSSRIFYTGSRNTGNVPRARELPVAVYDNPGQAYRNPNAGPALAPAMPRQ
jgi:zona occludens toxin